MASSRAAAPCASKSCLADSTTAGASRPSPSLISGTVMMTLRLSEPAATTTWMWHSGTKHESAAVSFERMADLR
eukprot:scaffold12139_cov111-Isochrysis_galbana.AAC.6